MLIFRHWKDVHGLDFEIYETPALGESMEALSEGLPLEGAPPLRVYEAELDAIEAKARKRWLLPRLWYLARIRLLRHQIRRLREVQIKSMLGRSDLG
jgi:hypothetical protein